MAFAGQQMVMLGVGYLFQAAHAGWAPAMVDLGQMYLEGRYFSRDPTQAEYWYRKAADLGDEEAKHVVKHSELQDNVDGFAGKFEYDRAYQTAEQIVELEEAKETTGGGRPGALTASALVQASWYALMSGEFDKALADCTRARSLGNASFGEETNCAHALLFLNRLVEAKAIYLRHRGETDPDNNSRTWEETVAADFSTLRGAGIDSPAMSEIERLLGIQLDAKSVAETAANEFWARNKKAEYERALGHLTAAVEIGWDNLVSASPQTRASIGPRQSDVLDALWEPIAQFYATKSGGGEVTECDRLVSFKFDPFRVAPGVDLGDIDGSAAVTACREAVAASPQSSRLHYLRGRALFRAGAQAAEQHNEAGAQASYAAAVDDYRFAMAAGYPAAFNNMSFMYSNGQGLPADPQKAAEFALETFNRVVECCATPIAKQMLSERTKGSSAVVDPAANALLLWSSALGSKDARSELSAEGTAASATSIPKAKFSDLPPWMRQ